MADEETDEEGLEIAICVNILHFNPSADIIHAPPPLDFPSGGEEGWLLDERKVKVICAKGVP